MEDILETFPPSELISNPPQTCDKQSPLSPEILNCKEETNVTIPMSLPRKPRNSARISPRYKTRNLMKPRRYYGRAQYNSTATLRKQVKTKRSYVKARSLEHGDDKMTVKKIKSCFHQLSPADQKTFLEEMVSEGNLLGVMPPVAGSLDKGLRIHNIQKCIIQIDPVHGSYFAQSSTSDCEDIVT